MPHPDTEQYRNTPLKSYKNIDQLSDATGVPREILSVCRTRGYPGIKPNGRIKWSELKPRLEADYDALVEAVNDDVTFWNKENKKLDCQIKELKKTMLQKNMIEPADVAKLVTELGVNVSVIIKSIFAQLTKSVVGKTEPEVTVILEEKEREVFNLFKKSAEEWSKKNHDAQ